MFKVEIIHMLFGEFYVAKIFPPKAENLTKTHKNALV